jgi:hypothetical protein
MTLLVSPSPFPVPPPLHVPSQTQMYPFLAFKEDENKTTTEE